MPIYEYGCGQCRRRFTQFFRGFSQVSEPACPHCGNAQVTRLISRFAVVKGDSSSDLPSWETMSDFDEDDPRSTAKMMRRLRKEMGEDAGPEFDEMVDRMEAGEMPEDMDGDDGAGEVAF